MKAAKIHDLYTPEIEKMDRKCPWADYPRPWFKRDSYLNLNGEWEFAICRSEEIPEVYGERILVPFPPESLLSGIHREIKRGERMYYRRRVTLPTVTFSESTSRVVPAISVTIAASRPTSRL